MRAIESSVSRSCILNVDFPDWPFRIQGNVLVYSLFEVLGPRFGTVLEDLAARFHDAEICVLGWNGDDYLATYGGYPGFRLDAEDLVSGFWAGLSTNQTNESDKYNAGETLYDYIAITGESRQWAVWGQRDWDVALLVVSGPTGGIGSRLAGRGVDALTDPDYVVMDFGISRADWESLRSSCASQRIDVESA
ncbi:hypothetical protein RWH44_06900 [Microbacterium sp. KSW2-29]|uniref:Barstar (barnase inhibitor) domain-containing protein n=1 Tax=Microbacterium phycohabitans TaxID=3075993 RepID=A0ABU3SLG8_9MICO|nr:hypothetical protein [Microbacterium sp. KSW2-29]MDU0345431.1 hypothetical protein [Microbacterium sp. KSW2-29]